MNYLFKQGILGGTFDRLHLGHQKLIDTAFHQSEHITIGLTKPNMYQHKALAETIESFAVREANLKKYLREKHFFERAEIIPIHNMYGTTLEVRDIEAIFATEENIRNLHKINGKRNEIGFPELHIVIVDYVKDANGENITSERIRKGEIDKSGFVYKNLFQQTLHLSEELRSKLRTPFGDVIKDTEGVLKIISEKTFVIAVGDIIVNSLVEKNFVPQVSVIDFKTRREVIEHGRDETLERITNEQGTINSEAVNALQEKINQYLATNREQTLVIEGEEDLLALPAILLAPLEAIVLYGQFDQGVVINYINEKTKRNARNFLL